MAKFHIEANGGKYEIEAPDENAAFEAFSSLGSPTPAPSPGQTAEPTATDRVLSTAKDVAKSAVSGIDAGVAGIAGLPADVAQLVAIGADKAESLVTGQPVEQVKARNDARAIISPETLKAWGSEAAHAGSPLAHTPETTAGKYAETISSFVPAAALPLGTGSVARNVFSYGVIPGAASEAAGQATAGTPVEPWARGGAAIATGGAAALWNRPSNAGGMVSRATEGVAPNHIDAAEALFQDAQKAGIPLTRANALDAVTNGATSLSDLQRVVEGRGGLRGFFAPTEKGVENAGKQAFDTVAPATDNPSAFGPAVQDAARAGVAQTPEGQAVAQRVWEAGPRTTPEQAGRVIQPELKAVQDRREGMRAALADQDYAAARNAPAEVPLDGGYGVRDVTKHYDRPGPGIYLDPAEREAATAEWMRGNNATERMPVIGLEPTRYGQADASSVVSTIDDALKSAKGSVADGLKAARRALFTPDGQVDATVAGLHGSRTAITDLIDQAKRAGANNTVRELEGALGTLDTALESVPAYGAAKRNFEAASAPLAPFAENRAPGQIVARDQYGKSFEMPPEKVPSAIDAGSSAARDFNAVASPEARQAYEQHLATKVLDSATDAAGNVSADRIRSALRENEDLLNQFPAVRDRLTNVAIARDGMAKVEQSPLGKIAERPDVKSAVSALFPANPLPGSAKEVSEAVSALSKNNPIAARTAVRLHMESVFNEATQQLQSGANQLGGAKFAAVLRGNPQQAANLEAAVKALPNGEKTWTGIDRFLEVLEAQGQRQRIGSQTSFNSEVMTDLKKGKAVTEAGALAAGGFLKWPQKAMDKVEGWRMGKGLDELARLFTDPKAGAEFRKLATARSNSNAAVALTGRLAALGWRGAQSRSAAGDKR